MKKYFPKATILLISLFIVIFVTDFYLLEGFLVKQGALNQHELFLHNQWWRVVTASFLHSGWMHLLLNAVTIYFAGVFLEKKIGIAYFIAAFIVCNTITHIILSFVWTFESSVGGSAGIYALIGILTICFFRDKTFLIKQIKNPGMYWLLIYFVIGLVRGFDALFAHSIGFICGILSGIALSQKHGD